ncbi:hypothetical protein Fmac_028585 [Flemingia macrophylla]|uniref:Kinesin motor domain-containing protein n=1 Tax=Flemingia macrophylla TaxID=520843 RepID=A0ABD1L7Y2_9FABA
MAPNSYRFSARNDAIVIRGVLDLATDKFAEPRKVEGKLDALVNLVTQLAANQKLVSVARACGIRSSNDHHTSVCPSSQQSGVDELPKANTLEGKLDALVNLVTQLAANQKPASVARVCGIRSSNDHHTSFSERNEAIVIRGVHDVATDTSAETGKLEGKLDALVNLLLLLQVSAASVLPMTTILVYVLLRSNLERVSILRLNMQAPIANHDISKDKALDREDGSQLLALDALVNLVTQLATNQKPASVARVCGIRSFNEHHTNKAGKLEGILDALLNLVTKLPANQKHASIVRVCGIRSSNDHHTSVYPFSQQSGVDEHPEAYAVNTYSRPPQQGVHDVATDTSAENRKLEGKLDAIVNLLTPLASNQKPASIARVYGICSSNHHHTSVCPSSQQSEVDEHPEAYATNTYSRPPLQARDKGVHDVATRYICDTRKLEGKLDALVKLVTQLAANQKPAFVVRVCGIRSSNDQHTSVCPSFQQSGVDEHPEADVFSARNDVIAIKGVHDVAKDTSADTRKLEGKLDALVNLVTRLAANRSFAFVVRVCGIRSSNDQHTSVCPSSQQSGVDEYREAYAANTYADHHSSRHKALDRKDGSQLLAVHNLEWMSILRLMLPKIKADHHGSNRDKALDRKDTSVEPRKLKGKLDALVNLVTQLASNQKLASAARVYGIRSSNDHHTSTTIAAKTRYLIKKMAPNSMQFSARNDAIVIRGVHDVATDTSAETRKLEGKLDSLVNLVTQLASNQKPSSVARVCDIRSSNDHHTSFNARNDAIVIRGVHDVTTDKFAETRKLEGKLDALVNLVTQTTTVEETWPLIEKIAPTSWQFSARNDAIVIKGVYDVATDTSAETRKLEGKIDALVNLVTQLATNQKPASVARFCGIRSSNDHHTSV